MKIDRYLAFASLRYYPEGGMGDFIGSFRNEADALSAITVWFSGVNDCEGAGDILDLETGKYRVFTRAGRNAPLIERDG